MQIPASGSAADTYLNDTQNVDMPVVAQPAKGLRSAKATPYWLLLPGPGVAGCLLHHPADLVVLDLPAVARQ